MNEHTALTSLLSCCFQAQLLGQLNDEEFWHYATEIALSPSVIQDRAEEYLLCDLNTRRCIFPLALIGEIMPPPHQLTLLPAVPPWMLGMTVWRGEMIALIDLQAYLWKDPYRDDVTTPPSLTSQSQAADLLLVVQFQDIALGLMVTAVRTTMNFDEEHIVPVELAPDWCSMLRQEVIRGVLNEALVLNMPFILTTIVQQIKSL